MIIQNVSSAALAPNFAGESAPVAVAPPQTHAAQVEPAVSSDAAPQATQQSPSQAQLQSAVDSINKSLKQQNSNLEFSIDSDTKKTVIKVVEATTGDVIRQFPSEEVLAISRAIDQMQQLGVLLRQQA